MINQDTKHERILGALILGGAADALGWQNETAPKGTQRKPITRLTRWSKRIGRVGGYWEKIEPGEYSDDTQLTLAVARCVSPSGEYDAERFARVELPYWLSYQRGGGRTVKAAARNTLSRRNVSWDSNFFEGYEQSGANGAAMRVLALAVINDLDRMTTSVWRNAITTHGHPRAIIGALSLTFSLHYLLRTQKFSLGTFFKELIDFVTTTKPQLDQEPIRRWVERAGGSQFLHNFENSRAEMAGFLALADRKKSLPKEHVLQELGCYERNTKGSGTGTVAAAHYFFLKYYEKPLKGIIEATNSLGTDTDTIGKFCGNLLGCLHGKDAYENELTEQVQDRYYFLRMANYLVGREKPHWNNPEIRETKITEPKKEGDEYLSPIFGPGIISEARKPRLIKQGKAILYQARTQFLCGVTCVFSKILPKSGNRQKTQDIQPRLWQ